MLEIHGLMGAIGEQLGMAWTAEQDAQRLVLTSYGRHELTNRLMLRAQSESSGTSSLARRTALQTSSFAFYC
jgi:hypothetical protein